LAVNSIEDFVFIEFLNGDRDMGLRGLLSFPVPLLAVYGGFFEDRFFGFLTIVRHGKLREDNCKQRKRE
jgi:hypothetical protein